MPCLTSAGIFSACASVEVAALHKVIDVDHQAAQIVNLQRLVFVLHAAGDQFRVERLLDRFCTQPCASSPTCSCARL